MDDQHLAAEPRDMDAAQGTSASASASASGSGSGSGPRSSSPLPVEVQIQTDDGRLQDQTGSAAAQGVEAKRKKLFALFQKKNKVRHDASYGTRREGGGMGTILTQTHRHLAGRCRGIYLRGR